MLAYFALPIFAEVVVGFPLVLCLLTDLVLPCVVLLACSPLFAGSVIAMLSLQGQLCPDLLVSLYLKNNDIYILKHFSQ